MMRCVRVAISRVVTSVMRERESVEKKISVAAER